MTALQQAILRTLIYFDLFDYPLTLMEIFKWLYIADDLPHRQASTDGSQTGHRQINQIEEALGQLSDKVENQNGFYFLKGRESLIQTRLSRYNISEEKFKRAIKFIKILRFIPFIKCLIVCNRLGYSNVHHKSDIDLAVVAEKNRLWLARLLAVGWLSILKVRPQQINRSQAIDLSFFVSANSLNLESLKFNRYVIFPYWFSQFIPVYDDGVFKKLSAANQWLKMYLPNYYPYSLNQRRLVSNNIMVRLIKRAIGLFIDWNFLESWSKSYQLKIMPPELKAMMNQDNRVVVNDQVLKFHRSDNRREVQEKFDESISLYAQ